MDEAATAALARIIDRVHAAHADGTLLRIEGGGSKAFYGEGAAESPEQTLSTLALRGITSYEPTELVVSALGGTPLEELEAALAARGQCLAFEPPRFGPRTTVGGMVAAGLAGPARAACGGVRDFLLGASLVNGRGELLHFGGQVMKNVAGYDVSRLLAGSLGVLGVICEVSLKVLPVPAARRHLAFEMTQADALLQLDRWGGEPLPLRASLWHEGRLVVQLAGARAAVDAARGALGGEELGTAAGDLLWQQARDQDHAYFAAALRTLGEAVPGEPPPVLWRIAVPAARPPLALAGSVLVEWGGGQRWVLSREPAARVRTLAAALGGHATAFRRPAALPDPCRGAVFTAPGAALERIHRELKRAFDPARIFNRGRLYPWL